MATFYEHIEPKERFYTRVKTDGNFNHINEFGILNLTRDKKYEEVCPLQETGLIILTGSCDILIGDRLFEGIGSRKSVFDGMPTAVYIPPGTKYSINSDNFAEVAICKTRCEPHDGPASLILGEHVKVVRVGHDNWSREVRMIVGPDCGAKNMVIGETLNPPGNWSGTPPHRHENDNLPNESLHEELYYFRTNKPQGWGMERIYSPERSINELIYITDNTVTFMPFGQHQVVAAPGYWLYYLFFLAGKGSRVAGFEDPEHKWIKSIDGGIR